MPGQARKTRGLAAVAAGILLQAGMAAVARMSGLPGVLLLTLAAWPLSAWLREKIGWACLVLPYAAFVVCFGVAGTEVLRIWLLTGIVALVLIHWKRHETETVRWQRETAIWGSVAAAGALAAIILLKKAYPQGIHLGLAQSLTDMIGGSSNSAEILYQLYQMGAVSLPRTMSVVETGADGMLYMSEEVWRQLLYGFRSGLEDALLVYVPAFAVYFTVLTTLLCVMLPVTVRRRRGEKDDTPRFDLWQLPKAAGTRIGILFLGGLLPILSDAPVLLVLGVLMNAVAGVTFCILGASVLRHAARRSGRSRTLSWVMILGAAVVIPQMVMLLGVADHVMDMRRLRKDNEMEEDRE